MSDGHDQHMRRAVRHPIPTRQEQVILGRAIREWQDWPDGPDAAPERVQRRGRRALNRMVTGNLRLVASTAKRYLHTGAEMDDLMQAGAESLMTAARKFDPASGYSFTTYATWWLRQGFQRGAMSKVASIRMPDSIFQVATQARGVAGNLEAELGRTPTAAEIAERMGGKVTAKTVREALGYLDRSRCSSLSAPAAATDGDKSRQDMVASDEDIWEEVERRDAIDRIRQALCYLKPEESELVRLVIYEDRTLAAIARERGVSREAVRQRWERVVRRIQFYLGARHATTNAGSGIHSFARRAQHETFSLR